MAEKIKIGGELDPRTPEKILGDASTIKDRTWAENHPSVAQTPNQKQDEINEYFQDQIDNIVATEQGGIQTDAAPTEGSVKLVQSGGTYASIESAKTFSTGEKVPNVGIDGTPTANSDNLVKSGGVQNELALGAVYDVSAKNPTAGPNNDGKFESLSALLSDANLSTLIPSSVRKGGMSVKFIQGTAQSSDNKYVQFRCMAQNFTTDVTQWQGVDTEPTAGSENLVESGGVAGQIEKINADIKPYSDSVGQNGNWRRDFNTYAGNTYIITLSGSSSVIIVTTNGEVNLGTISGSYEYTATYNGTQIKGWTASVRTLTIEKKDSLYRKIDKAQNDVDALKPVLEQLASTKKYDAKRLDVDGTLADSISGYYATEYIKAIAGTYFSKCRYIGASAGVAVCFYDSNFLFISSIIIGSDSAITLTSDSIPSGAVYCRANVYNDTVITRKGNDSNLEEIAKIVPSFNNLISTIDELSSTKRYNAKRLEANGVMVDSGDGYYATEYIKAVVGTHFSKCRYISVSSGAAVCFYDKDFQYVGNIIIPSDSAITLSNENIPNNAIYCRANVYSTTKITRKGNDLLIDELKYMQDKINAPQYSGKKYASLGSSTSTYSWHNSSVQECGMSYLGFGIGGAHFYLKQGNNVAQLNYNVVATDSVDNVIMNQIARLFKKNADDGYVPDYITLMSGLNDCYGDITGQTLASAMGVNLDTYMSMYGFFKSSNTIKSVYLKSLDLTDSNVYDVEGNVIGEATNIEEDYRGYLILTCTIDGGTYTYQRNKALDIISDNAPALWFSNATDTQKESTVINLRVAIEFLMRKFPQAQFVINTFQQTGNPSFAEESLEHFIEVELEMSHIYSVEVVDFWNKGGWSVKNNSISIYSNDLLHPNTLGNAMMKAFYILNINQKFRK